MNRFLTMSELDLRAAQADLAARLSRSDVSATEHAALMRESADLAEALATRQRDDARADLLGSPAIPEQVRAGQRAPQAPGTRHAAVPLGTAVDTFAASPQVQAFRSNGYTGRVGLEFPGVFHTRALVDTSPSSGGAFQNPTRPSDVPQTAANRPLRLADLLDQRDTDQNTVEWVQDTTTSGLAAGEVAEGAVKPESSLTFTVVSDPVRTIATWVNVTRQALDDTTALRGYVEGQMSYAVDARVDEQIVAGNGTAPNLRGILNTAGVGTYVAPAGEAAVISVRRAVTVVQGAQYAPDTVVMHPTDWERVELSQDSQGMFRVTPNVANAAAPRLWGLVVVATTAIPGTVGGATPAGGRFIVGAFRLGAVLWRRSSALFVTDSHASNFTSNVITLLAEVRVALSVFRPRAFAVGTLSEGTA